MVPPIQRLQLLNIKEYFFKPKLNKDSIIAAKTSRIGAASGYPKFHNITPINQII